MITKAKMPSTPVNHPNRSLWMTVPSGCRYLIQKGLCERSAKRRSFPGKKPKKSKKPKTSNTWVIYPTRWVWKIYNTSFIFWMARTDYLNVGGKTNNGTTCSHYNRGFRSNRFALHNMAHVEPYVMSIRGFQQVPLNYSNFCYF